MIKNTFFLLFAGFISFVLLCLKQQCYQQLLNFASTFRTKVQMAANIFLHVPQNFNMLSPIFS